MKEGKKDIKKEGSFPFIALLLLDLLTHWPKDYLVLNICPQNEMEIKMLGTGCTLAGEWVAVLWFLLSSWAFLPGNLRSHDRHRWIFQKGHFWQSVVNFLTYGTCLIFFFSLNLQMTILWCTLAFHSLESPGLPGRIVESLLNDSISALFLSIEEYCCWGFWRMDYFLGR